MKHFIYILIFLTACTAPTSDKDRTEKQEVRPVVEAEKEKVMAVHDIAMEKMGEMIKLKTDLKERMLLIDSTQIDVYRDAIQDLEYADKAMWDWMHGYKASIVDTSSIEVSLKYLKDQKIKVDVVAVKIAISLKNGYELLEK